MEVNISPIMSFSGTKPLYLTFGIHIYGLVICHQCSQAHSLPRDVKQASNYLYNHWRVHDSKENLLKSTYESWIEDVLRAHSKTEMPSATRNPLLCPKLFGTYSHLLEAYEFQKGMACSRCLLQKNLVKPCCLHSHTLATTFATLNGVKQFVLVKDDEFEETLSKFQQIPSPTATHIASINEDKVDVSMEGNQKTMVDFDLAQKRRDMISLLEDPDAKPENLLAVIRKCTVAEAADGTSLYDECNSEQEPKILQRNRNITQAEQSVLRVMGVSEIPSQEELENLASLSRHLDLTNTDDRIFKAAARILLSVSDEAISSHPAMVAWVMRAPIIDSPLQNVSEKAGGEAGVHLHGHFKPSQGEFEIRINHVGRYLRMMCERDGKFAEMFAEIKSQNPDIESDPSSVATIIHDIACVVAELFHGYCIGALKTSTISIMKVLRPFIAEIPVQRGNGNSRARGSSSCSSDSEEHDEDQDSDHEASQIHARISKPQRLRKILNSIMWLFKSCMLTECHRAWCRAIKERTILPLDVFIKSMLGGGNVAAIAMSLSGLSLIEEGTRNPGRNDVMWSENATDGPIMLLEGGIRIVPKDLSDCGRRVIEELMQSLGEVLFNGSAETKEDQAFWEKLKIGLFSDDKDYFKMKLDKQNLVRLSTSSSRARVECENILSKRKTDIKEYRNQLIALQKCIFASVFLFGGAVARPREVLRLIRGKSKSGTLFLDEDFQQNETLIFCDLVSKTKKHGKSLLPPWLSKVILLYLDVFAPAALGGMQKELRDAVDFGEDADRIFKETAWTTFETRTVEEWQIRLSTQVGAIPFLQADFKKSLEKFKLQPVKVAIKESQALVGNSMLDCGADQLDKYLHEVICAVGFGVRTLRLAQVRKILVNVKKQPQRFLPDPGKILDTIEANHVALILKSIAENAAEITMLEGLSSIAHNSRQTTLESYMARPARGMTDESMIEKRASRLAAEAGQIIFGAPFIISTTRSGSSKKVYLNQLPTSIWHGLQMATIADNQESAPEPMTILTEKLREVTMNENAKWLSVVQRDTAFIRFTTDYDMVLATSCGGGKTMSMILPALLAVQGFTVFLLPTRALVQDMMVTLRGLHIESPDEEVFREMDLDDPFFQSDAFQTMRWNEGTVTRIVLSTYDTGCKEKILPWYTAARRRGLLNGFFIDEIHQLFLSASYRSIMFQMPVISDVGVPVAVASGTLPGAMEDAVIERMRLGKRGLKRKKTPTIYLDRRVVDLWRVKECKDIEEWTFTTIQSFHERRPLVDNRPYMVFCMTMEGANGVARRLSDLAGVRVAQIDSTVKDSDIQALLIRIREGTERYILVGTSAAAEGIDLPSVGLVIVLHGTYGGLLTLHQMFARSGRGSPSVEVLEPPRCILVYCPDKFPGNSTAYANDQKLLKAFPNGYDGKVEKFVGFESIENLFKVKEGKKRCGGKLMEDLFDGGEENSKSCTLCLDCNPKLTKTLYTAPRGESVWSHGQALVELAKSRAAKFGSPSKAPPGAPIVVARSPSVLEESLMEEQESLRRAWWFLQKASHKCPLCGLDVHYPNLCRVMQSTCVSSKIDLNGACNICFQHGHFYSEHIKPALNTKKAESVVRNFGCLVWVNSGYGNRADPCDKCWIIHSEDSPLACKGYVNPCRPILLKVFYDEKLRREFFNSTRHIKDTLKDVTSVHEFMRWAVRGKGLSASQNLMSVVAFWSRRQQWLKAPLE